MSDQILKATASRLGDAMGIAMVQTENIEMMLDVIQDEGLLDKLLADPKFTAASNSHLRMRKQIKEMKA